MKKISNLLQAIFVLSCAFGSNFTYAVLTSYSPAGGTYNLNLNSAAVVSSTTATGSDGNIYYPITPPNQSGIVVNETNSNPTGMVECQANYLQGDYKYWLGSGHAYHRIFSYMPEAGLSINGLPAYKINANTFFTIYSRQNLVNQWVKISSQGCSIWQTGPLPASFFTVQFPFEIRIYVKNVPIDGNIIIPDVLLAGYSRIFQNQGVVPDYNVPADKATILLKLNSSVVKFPSSCKVNINNLNIEHDFLDSTSFNSIVSRYVTYECLRSEPVRLMLDYVTDSDPEKRVPLKSGNNTIYTELMLYDEQSNKKGKVIETTIDGIKNIRVESHLSGSSAEPGDYRGNAWLIASFI
ncbi:adhesin [Klebsiella aerogenes]|uniref:adhesin n=1 Tax=Klebsiella aerogenes TaxID=548 RepID=UPI002DBA9E1B|nr:adhesin [Klebsiella aerogenes]MEB7534944.1 adhesin [Klebsiella aerogenes]